MCTNNTIYTLDNDAYLIKSEVDKCYCNVNLTSNRADYTCYGRCYNSSNLINIILNLTSKFICELCFECSNISNYLNLTSPTPTTINNYSPEYNQGLSSELTRGMIIFFLTLSLFTILLSSIIIFFKIRKTCRVKKYTKTTLKLSKMIPADITIFSPDIFDDK